MSTEAPPAGWYADPDNPATQRYWDGTQWLVPMAQPVTEPDPPTTTAQPAAQDELPAEGWYLDPDAPGKRRWWDGNRLIGGYQPAEPDDPALPPAAAEHSRAAENRTFLWTNYIAGALIPIWGYGVAIYVAVSEKHAKIRRHALGILAVAVLASGIYAVVIASSISSHQDVNAANDLQTLLTDHGVFASNVQCAHQAGNQYQCSATINGQQQFASVTDDGHQIYETGISASGG